MNWTRLTRITAPDSSPIDTTDLKRHLAIAHSDEDDLLASYIGAATAYIDGPRGAGVALLTQTYRLSLDYLPRHFELPIGPVKCITTITVDGVAVDPSLYSLDADQTPATVSCIVPSNSCQPGSVKVTFKAGFGDRSSDVPADLLHAIRMIAGHLYANREAVSDLELKSVPLAVETILNRYRVNAY